LYLTVQPQLGIPIAENDRDSAEALLSAVDLLDARGQTVPGNLIQREILIVCFETSRRAACARSRTLGQSESQNSESDRLAQGYYMNLWLGVN